MSEYDGEYDEGGLLKIEDFKDSAKAPSHQKQRIWDACLAFHAERQLGFGTLHTSTVLSSDSVAPRRFLVACL